MRQIRVILEGRWIVDSILPEDEVEPVVDACKKGMREGVTCLLFDINKYINPSKIVAIEVNEVPDDK
ncbi:hypothetical protein CA207_14790 [Macrococcoides caseolyticum]|uniref:hypothetical protein n=1 Tax=Macrococcoides caseolyticum TaxID=69966 RepID=UPI000A28E9E6|nr:hypothetical protein [Macrococcus caseolyticus]ARQ04725.1 hypothetical protein CA207_14790 [Macrococcus caseolyticus]